MASGFWSRSVTVEGATAAERALHREEKHDHLQEYLRWRGYSEPSERSQRRIDPRRLHPLTDVPNWLEASHERMERDPMTMTRSEKKATVTLQSVWPCSSPLSWVAPLKPRRGLFTRTCTWP